jgi:hypothetical protein
LAKKFTTFQGRILGQMTWIRVYPDDFFQDAILRATNRILHKMWSLDTMLINVEIGASQGYATMVSGSVIRGNFVVGQISWVTFSSESSKMLDDFRTALASLGVDPRY